MEVTQDIYGGLFGDLVENRRKVSPIQMWKSEINSYQAELRATPTSDPLLWWKVYETRFPTLGMFKLLPILFCPFWVF